MPNEKDPIDREMAKALETLAQGSPGMEASSEQVPQMETVLGILGNTLKQVLTEEILPDITSEVLLRLSAEIQGRIRRTASLPQPQRQSPEQQVQSAVQQWLREKPLRDAHRRYEMQLGDHALALSKFNSRIAGVRATPFERWQEIEARRLFPGTRVHPYSPEDQRSYTVKSITFDCYVLVKDGERLIGKPFSPLNLYAAD